MCVAAIAWACDPRWRLVAVGNRDEYHARPAAQLGQWTGSRIIAGRDLEAGGTWMGVSAERFGLVTNLRVAGYPRPELASRGALISDWLRGNASFGGIPAVRSPADTEKFAREQVEVYEKLGVSLGLRK